MAGLQECDFAFNRGFAGAESDPRDQLMRKGFQFDPGYILRQIERHPQKAGHDFVEDAGAGIESGLVGVCRGRRTKGAKTLHGDPDIHARKASRVRAGMG